MQALVRTRGVAAAGATRRPSPPAPAASKLAGDAGAAMKIGTSIPAASKHCIATTVVTMVKRRNSFARRAHPAAVVGAWQAAYHHNDSR